MLLVLLGGFFALATLVCSLPILRYAFGRSLGTGVMVLLVPCYVVYFAFSQFEHPRKSLVVTAWLGSLLLTAVWMGLFAAAVAQLAPPGAL